MPKQQLIKRLLFGLIIMLIAGCEECHASPEPIKITLNTDNVGYK